MTQSSDEGRQGPVDGPATADELSRRKFLTGMIGLVAGAVAALVAIPAIAFIASPGFKRQNEDEWYTLGPVSDLEPGLPKGFPYSRAITDGWVKSVQTGVAYAITPDGKDVTVLSNVCTHLSCRVTWSDELGGYFCPCHDGLFGPYGEVLAGPPPRPLHEFPSRIVNGQIEILLEA